MSTPLPWITDRPPLQDDGDEDGDVVVMIEGSTAWALLPWRQVKAGTPWLAFTSLISAKPAAKPSVEPLSQPRRFVSINRIVLEDGAYSIDAVADDGTAWWTVPGEFEWTEMLPPLPPRETHETHPPHLT